MKRLFALLILISILICPTVSNAGWFSGPSVGTGTVPDTYHVTYTSTAGFTLDIKWMLTGGSAGSSVPSLARKLGFGLTMAAACGIIPP